MTMPPAPPRLSRPQSPNATPPLLAQGFTATMMGIPFRNGQVCAIQMAYVADYAPGENAMVLDIRGAEYARLIVTIIGNKMHLTNPAQPGPPVGPIVITTPVPGQDWLQTLGLTLQGHGDLMNRPCDWWLGYSPNQNGYVGPTPATPKEVCNWFWIDQQTQFPFRMSFTSTGNPTGLPLLGGYFSTLNTTYYDITILEDHTDLLQASAQATAPDAALESAVQAADSFDALLEAVRAHAPDLEVATAGATAGDLITGLGPAPANATAPFWSPRMWLTGYTFQTARPEGANSGDDALPLRVFYEWDANGKHMLTRCALSQYGFEDVPVMDIILSETGNTTVIRFPDGSTQNAGTGPMGLVKPDWASQDSPVFRAQIVDNPVLCPGKTLIVTTLPSDHGRWFWVWYTPEGLGQLFMETPQCGDVGLVLTDYYSFDTNPPAFPPGWHTVPG